MGDQPETAQPLPPAEPATVDASGRFWTRLRDHKVIQWGVAYLGGALALAQAQDLVGNAFGWPAAAERVVMVALLVGLPVVLTLAWYHGHRGFKSISAGELSIISVLMLIGGLLFTATMRTGGAHSSGAVPAVSTPVQLPPSSSVGSNTAPASQGVLPNSVAVLPCVNQSPDPNEAYIASGLHEEINQQLAKLRSLTVVPRRAVMRYAESTLAIPAIAAELRVGAIVDCTVRYANNRVRISAELIDAASERSAWSDVYERSFDDVLAIQADIAMNIANAIGAEYSPDEQAEIERPATTSPEAYRLYLQARTSLAMQSPNAIRQGGLLLERALQLDPNFALARGQKVMGEVFQLADSVGPRPQGFQAASAASAVRAEVEAALAGDLHLPQAAAAKATLELLTWHWDEALDQYRAITDDMILIADGAAQYAFLTAYLGNSDEGIRFLQRIAEVDPQFAYQMLGIMQGYAHDFDEAVVNLRKAQDLLPLNPLVSNWIAYMEIARGNEAKALDALDYSLRILAGEMNMAFWPEFAYAYHRLGRPDEARRFYDDIVRASERRSIGAGTWALASLAIGDEAKALEWLEVVAGKAANHEIDEGVYAALNLKMNFMNDPLINDPRFAEVLGRIRGD
jgi:TolB-like protein/Flp pilus assembly protein TadD